ncbi:MAG: hypothetical protein JW818_06515 [Pirellulales bacterium]|nr:hypothetical protein [Pirellulales bacterium]
MTRLIRNLFLILFFLDCSNAIAGGVTPFGNVLLWHASEETSSIWSSAVTTAADPNTFSASNVRFGWSPGFRVGLSHEPDSRSWDTRLYWTYFRSSENAAIPIGAHNAAPEFFSGFVSGDLWAFDNAAMNWSVTYHTVDFELGRSIAVGQSVVVRPSLGLKAAFIDQTILTHWNSLLGPFGVENVDHAFRGFGPTFGIDGRWNLPRLTRLNVVASFSGALLWGGWNVDDTYERVGAAILLPGCEAFTTSMKDSSLGTLNLNYFVGLEWVRQGDVTITARLGYELQWWANQQRLPTFQQLPMHGDLSLQGLTFGITVAF